MILQSQLPIRQYEGRPTDEQIARAAVLRHQLDDVVQEFNDLAAKQLPEINRQLTDKHLKTIEVINEQQWQEAAAETTSANAIRTVYARHADRDTDE